MVTQICEDNKRKIPISGTLYEYEEFDRSEMDYNKQHIIAPNAPNKNGVIEGFFEASLIEENTWDIRWYGDTTPVGTLKAENSEEVVLFLDMLERSFTSLLCDLSRNLTLFVVEESRFNKR